VKITAASHTTAEANTEKFSLNEIREKNIFGNLRICVMKNDFASQWEIA
jgi:hypothetical protein